MSRDLHVLGAGFHVSGVNGVLKGYPWKCVMDNAFHGEVINKRKSNILSFFFLFPFSMNF